MRRTWAWRHRDATAGSPRLPECSPGQASGRIKIDTGSAATTLTLNNAATSADADTPAVLWKGTSSSNLVNVNKGTLGCAWFGKESANIATLTVGQQNSPTSDAVVYCGNVTFATSVVQRAGSLRPPERLDLGPAFFERGQVGRIRRQVEQPDASGGTGVHEARHFMGFEIVHDEDLAWPELRHKHLPQKSKKDLAIGEAEAR